MRIVGQTIFADRDPTTEDDCEFHAVVSGMIWVNESSGAVFVNSNEATKRAVWKPFVHAAISDAVTAATAAIAAIPLNHAAASAPGATNDTTEGFSAFSRWHDTTGPDIYECTDATADAAVWVKIFETP